MVLVPGWAASLNCWSPLIKPLSDLPRHYSLYTEQPYPSSHVDASLNVPGVLVGWSLGGMLCIESAARFPERVRGLVLFATLPRFVDPGGIIGWSPRIVDRMRRRVQDAPEETVAAFVDRQFSDDDRQCGVPEAYAQACQSSHWNTDMLADGLQYLIDADLRHALDQLECPILFVHGSDDGIAPIAGFERLRAQFADSANVSFECLDGAGHVPFWSDAERCADLIRTMMMSCSDGEVSNP
jgi:pimeloyl-[acyl-carrier protein] methyl ester esterase